jgi:LacI family transcriptional regulator
METVNLKKLAEQLGLSVSTVSKAFQDSYDISPVTKERILALAKQLNYQPNPLASSLRKQKSKTIAVVIPEIANNFFSLAINGIESVASEKGYHVLIYLTHEDYSKEVSFVQHLQSGRVEGVLLSLSDGTKSATHLDDLHKKGIPIVFFDRIYEDMETTKVATDNYESGYKATQHLIEQGCTKIANFFYSKRQSIANKRMEGYLQALKDYKLPIEKKYLVECSNDNEENHQLIREVLQGNKRPDGIFSSFEKLAILSYQACEELHLSIPKDVQIISFSNLETAALLNPSLTTITQPAYEIGREAALALFQALDKKTATVPNKQIIIPSQLIQRKSTSKDLS